MKLTKRLAVAWKAFRFSGAGGRTLGGAFSSFLAGLLPGTRQDWAKKVGDRWRSSAVSIALTWITNSFPEAPLAIKRRTSTGVDEFVPDHPLLALIKRPNAFYGQRKLWAGTLISYLCHGNAYWLKVRNNGGQVCELWYLPHFQVEPQWPEDGSIFIENYAYTVNGVTTFIDPKDIVHFRNGIDPRNTRKGLAPLAQQDRQIASDNEGSTYHAAMLENFGIPGLVISPTGDQADFDEEEDGERIKKLLAARTTGDERGKPIIFPIPIKVDTLGFTPEQMALDKLYNMPLVRVFGQLSLDPMVAGQPSESKTYSNYAEARRGGWEDCIRPLMAQLCEELDLWLLPESIAPPESEGIPVQSARYNAADLYCAFDLRNVLALQDDLDRLTKRIVEACGGPVLTPNEGRQKLGLEPLADTKYDTLREKAAPVLPGEEGSDKSQKGLRTLLRLRKGEPAPLTEWAERASLELANVNGAEV